MPRLCSAADARVQAPARTPKTTRGSTRSGARSGTSSSRGSETPEISRFVKESNAAAKSIGVEYLESADRLVITLGYRDDEEGYPVKLSSRSLGKIEALGSDFTELERRMTEAAAEFSNIICHELYVTEEHDFMMIFMTHGG
jgi:hypothetical protein